MSESRLAHNIYNPPLITKDFDNQIKNLRKLSLKRPFTFDKDELEPELYNINTKFNTETNLSRSIPSGRIINPKKRELHIDLRLPTDILQIQKTITKIKTSPNSPRSPRAAFSESPRSPKYTQMEDITKSFGNLELENNEPTKFFPSPRSAFSPISPRYPSPSTEA